MEIGEVIDKMNPLQIPVIFLGEDSNLGARLGALYQEIIWGNEYRIAPFYLATLPKFWVESIPKKGPALVFVEISASKNQGTGLAEQANLIRDICNSNGSVQIALLAEDDADYFAIAETFHIGNVLKKKAFDAAVLRALTIRLMTGNIFGFDPYFPNGYTVGPLYRTFVGEVVVEDAIEDCVKACLPYVNANEASSFKIFLNELLLNTFSYSIQGITPEDRDAKLLQAPPIVQIAERRGIKVSLVADAEKVGVSVQDSTGNLSMLRVMQKLRRQSRIGGEKMPPGIWDESGRGISMVYRYSRFIVNILKGVRTEIIFLHYHKEELNRFESIIITEVQPF